MDEINGLAAYQWWEGSVHSILSVLGYPLAWSWLQRCRKNKLQRLREYVRSEYDHACLRSCRSRALYEGLKVFPCITVSLFNFFFPPFSLKPEGLSLVFKKGFFVLVIWFCSIYNTQEVHRRTLSRDVNQHKYGCMHDMHECVLY